MIPISQYPQEQHGAKYNLIARPPSLPCLSIAAKFSLFLFSPPQCDAGELPLPFLPLEYRPVSPAPNHNRRDHVQSEFIPRRNKTAKRVSVHSFAFIARHLLPAIRHMHSSIHACTASSFPNESLPVHKSRVIEVLALVPPLLQ